MNRFFPEINGNFGFGCMRLPIKDGEVDFAEFSRMADAFIEAGFNYFDTAHGYVGGKSETAVRECVSRRYPREKFLLTDKLSSNYFQRTEDIRPLFESQLEACGVDYFDFYLMHAQDKEKYEKYTRLRAYETAYDFKREGKIRHFGISFHDTAELLDKILTEHPEIEAVQLQFNYMDYDDPAVQSKKCYDVCVKHGKPVIVMEPVRGGGLVNLPSGAREIIDELGGTPASYALRFTGSFDDVMLVLSGMGNIDMVRENVSTMKDFVPLNERELDAISKVRGELGRQNLIQCTACRYCMERCPIGISIPDLFAVMNSKTLFKEKNWNANYYYGHIYTSDGRRASDCIRCGACEAICPQHLEIRNLLASIAEEFEK